MSIKRQIRRGLLITGWLAIGGGVLFLLAAAINKKNHATCAGYDITIGGTNEQVFIDKKDIVDLLTREGKRTIRGELLRTLDLRKMEAALEKSVWVSDAELFFDNNRVLRVNIREREPVARIFTDNGRSFYLDSSGTHLPLSDRFSARLPVFTGFPDKPGKREADSTLLEDVKHLSGFIRQHPFWMDQIEQVVITPGRTFEMVPALGDNRIIFGNGSDYEQKFHRLLVFYLEVLRKTGFDKYSKINVQYARQVVATRRGGGESKADSLQAIRTIGQMIRSAQELSADPAKMQPTRPLENSTPSGDNLANYDLVPDTVGRSGGTTSDDPGKATMNAGPVPAPAKHPSPAAAGNHPMKRKRPEKPKAVMPAPRKPENN